MLFGGGGVKTAMFVGQYDAAIDAGKQVDLIIGSCGGSIGAAIVTSYPDKNERLKFLKSVQLYNLFKTFQVDPRNILMPLSKILQNIFFRSGNHETSTWYGVSKPTKVVPDIFDFALLNIDKVHFPYEIKNGFNEQLGPSVILVAAQIHFNKEDQNKKIPYNTKLYTETYFTDEKTAGLIKPLLSPVGYLTPHSFINEKTQVLSGINLDDAVKASIADPYLIKPHIINEEA